MSWKSSSVSQPFEVGDRLGLYPGCITNFSSNKTSNISSFKVKHSLENQLMERNRKSDLQSSVRWLVKYALASGKTWHTYKDKDRNIAGSNERSLVKETETVLNAQMSGIENSHRFIHLMDLYTSENMHLLGFTSQTTPISCFNLQNSFEC